MKAPPERAGGSGGGARYTGGMITEAEPPLASSPHPGVERLVDRMRRYLPAADVDLALRAYQAAAAAHAGQQRASGGPYIEHPLAAAVTCADLQLDACTIAAALLHDVQEDCGIPNAEIARQFGEEVARLVDSVTKLGHLPAPSAEPGRWGAEEQAQAENLRRMFIAMAEDIRVVIVKLADRLHNMETLDALPPAKQQRIAAETMEIYAPLAARLGIWQLKWQLEDLAFRTLQPEEYRRIAGQVDARRSARERYLAQLTRKLQDALAQQGIRAEVTGRVKHIYSIWQKMQRYAAQGKSFSDIYDLLALRVIVESPEDCYNALGVVHQLWRPVPGEFDDYVGHPKSSGYRSLHTTVCWQGTRPLEVQIRSAEMHREAEYGVAAHWQYKEGHRRRQADRERLSWLKQLMEWQRDLPGAAEFVETLKSDIFQDQVYVYTPRGEIKDLPAGATPLDFAFRIHTDVGYACAGARVNGRLVPLTSTLRNGDVVEIITSRASRGPSRDWLNSALGFLKTQHARSKVRQWFRRLDRQETIDRGREDLEKALRRLSLSMADLESMREALPYQSLEDLLTAIGVGEIGAHQIALKLALRLPADTVEAPPLPAVAAPRERTSSAIHVLGAPGLLTRFAECCHPLPGDLITGYITRSRGVTVHRSDCHNVIHTSERQRLVDVQWGSAPGSRYAAQVRIGGWDRIGFVRDVSTILADEGINLVGLRTEEPGDGRVTVRVTVETDGLAHLQRAMGKLEMARGVQSVEREH